MHSRFVTNLYVELKVGLHDMLTIEYQYVRIYTNSVGMQAVVERTLAETDTDVPQDEILPLNLEPRDYDFIQEVVDGSCQILQKVVQLSESGALRYSPVRIFLRITTSSIYLIKGLSLGSRNQKLQSSLDILDAAIRALRASGYFESLPRPFSNSYQVSSTICTSPRGTQPSSNSTLPVCATASSSPHAHPASPHAPHPPNATVRQAPWTSSTITLGSLRLLAWQAMLRV